MDDAAWASYETAQECDDAGDAEGAAHAYQACATAWRILWLSESESQGEDETQSEAMNLTDSYTMNSLKPCMPVATCNHMD